jgi:O-antigen/teichoic acid export membrane protein
MQQITTPITAKEMNQNNINEVGKLYQQTSINLLVIGGLLFLLINLNINYLYEIINKPQFSEGILIVLIISCAKLVELALGTANAILVNSKYYKIFFYLSLAMAISVIILNKWLINLIGINGAALATFLVVFLYSFIKIFYIKSKFKIQPFGINTVKIMFVIFAVYIGFYFWDFEFHPIVNMLLKSIAITLIYVIFVKILKVSKDLNLLINKFTNK